MAVSWLTLYYKPHFTQFPLLLRILQPVLIHVSPTMLILHHLQWRIQDLKKGGARGLPQDFFENFSQFRVLFKYLPKIGGGGDPWIRHWSYPTYFEALTTEPSRFTDKYIYFVIDGPILYIITLTILRMHVGLQRVMGEWWPRSTYFNIE